MVWGGSRTKPRAPSASTADYFCVAIFFALRFFLRVGVGWTGWAGVVGGIKFLARSAGRQVIQKIKEKVEDWGGLGRVKDQTTRTGSTTTADYFCVALFFALRFFLRCDFFCVAISFACWGGGWYQVLSPVGGTPSHSKDQRQGRGLGLFGGG